MTIIDRKLIDQALEIVKPGIEKLLTVPGMTWGPEHVDVCILTISGKDINRFASTFGKKVKWNPDWGKVDTQMLADEKAVISAREQANTSSICSSVPWLFEENEHLYGGGIYYANISIGVSGATEIVDQHIAEMILSQIILLARMEAEVRKKSQV